MRCHFLLLIGAICALQLAAGLSQTQGQQQTETEKVPVLIVTGDDVRSHPWRESTQFTRNVLEETGKYDVKVAEDINIFESSRLDQYELVVLNYGYWNLPELSDRGRDNLMSFVEQGG